MDALRRTEQRVTLHVPAGPGQFLEVRKFPTGLADMVRQEDGGVVFVEERSGQDCLTRATAEGEVVYRQPLEAEARKLLAARGKVYAVTEAGLEAFDPATGREAGAYAFGPHPPGHQPKVSPRPDGGFTVLQDQAVAWLDAGLAETARAEFPFELASVREVPGGGLVGQGGGDFYHLGNLQVRAADGRVLYQGDQVRASNADVTPDGRVLAVEYGPQHESRLVMVHPSGEVTKRECPTMARAVFAQADGTAVVFESSDYSPSAFVHYGADGAELRRYDFAKDERPRNFFADPARSQAYVVTQGNGETVVHRLSLKPQAGPPEIAVVARAQGNLVTLPPLEDGRLLVFGAAGATVYSPEGAVLETLPTLQSVHDRFGDAALGVNHVISGDHPFREQCSLDAWLPVAAKWLRVADRQAFQDGGARPGHPARGADRCLDFPRRVDSEAALKAMGFAEPMVYQRMLMRETDASLVAGASPREESFPGQQGRLEVSKDKVVVEVPGQEPQERSFLHVDAALPVKAGDEYYVALAENAGGSKRALAWCHPASRSFERFDVTAPIVGLYGGDADRVYAVGSNGAVLTIQPALAEGQHVQAKVNLPTALLQPEGEPIVVGTDTVSIGGLVLERRT